MTRVSQLELYNDKDVITQICMMKQMVETGTYAEVRVISTGGNYVFEFEDQNGDVQTFTVPAKQISGVTSSQSGSTVTMRVNYNDGSHTDVSWTAGGDVTTNTAQTISAVKTFTASPIIPDTPSGTHAAVNLTYVSKTDGTNNLLHTSGNETASGDKSIDHILSNNIEYLTANVLTTGDAATWYCVYRSRAMVGTFYDDVTLLVTRARVDFSVQSKKCFGLLSFSASKNNVGDAVWLLCGEGIDPANFVVIKNNDVCMLCMKGVTGINNGCSFSAIGPNDSFVPDVRALTPEESVLADAAAPSTVLVTL